MPYYLSYVENNGHSSLIISQQESGQPASIICEFGFGLSPDINLMEGNYFLTRTYKGDVREERLASKVLYSDSARASHRTYEISQAEVMKLLAIVNRDKEKDATEITLEDGRVVIIGGPDYQLVRNNCKTYLMGVLKEVGIIDAEEELSDFLIQRPGNKHAILTPLTADDLSCPPKEELIQEIDTTFTNLKTQMQELLEMYKNEFGEDSEEFRTVSSYIGDILLLSEEILTNKKKLGLNLANADDEQNLKKCFASIGQRLSQLKSFNNDYDLDERISDSVNDLNPVLLQQFTRIETLLKQVVKLSTENRLTFQWKTTPPVAKRAYLDNFNPEERAVYLVKRKGQSISDGLAVIIEELDNYLEKPNLSEELWGDIHYLKQVIEAEKEALDKTNEGFLNVIQTKSTDQIIGICAKQQKILNDKLDGLGRTIATLELDSAAEASVFMRFINKILAFIKKDYVKVENVTDSLKNEIGQLKKASQAEITFFHQTNKETEQAKTEIPYVSPKF